MSKNEDFFHFMLSFSIIKIILPGQMSSGSIKNHQRRFNELPYIFDDFSLQKCVIPVTITATEKLEIEPFG